MNALPTPPPDRTEPLREESRQHSRARRILLWVAAILGGLILLAIIAVLVITHSSWFRNYLLTQARQQASAALGEPIQIDRLDVTWSGFSPTADLYGVVIPGSAPFQDTTLLTVERLRAAVHVTSIVNRTWYLEEVRFDKPVVHLVVGPSGASNLPKPSGNPSNSSGISTLFNLGIRHAVINQGEIQYNDRKSQLSADLNGVALKADYQAGDNAYTGTLSYDNGRMQSAALGPIPSSLDASFVASPQQFVIKEAVLTTGSSRVVLHGKMVNYSQPQVQLDYRANLDTGQLGSLLHNPSLPKGVVDISGTARYAAQQQLQPLLQALHAEGQISSSSLSTSQLQGGIRNLNGKFVLANGDLKVNDLSANALGGKLAGSLVMTNLAGSGHSVLDAKVDNASLASFKQFMSSPLLQKADLAGTANGTISAKWGNSISNMSASADLALRGSMQPIGGGARQPVTGKIQAVYSAAANRLRFINSYIKTPQMSLSLNGSIAVKGTGTSGAAATPPPSAGTGGGMAERVTPGGGVLRPAAYRPVATVFRTLAMALAAQAGGGGAGSASSPVAAQGLQVNLKFNLSQIAAIASQLGVSGAGKAAKPLPPMHGPAAFNGSVSGSLSKPHIVGTLAASDFAVSDSHWNKLDASIDASPSGATIRNGVLVGPNGGTINFAFAARLHDWSLPKTNPLRLALTAANVNLENLAKLAGSSVPLAGSLNAKLALDGTLANPRGSGVATVRNARLGPEPVRLLKATFNGTGQAVNANLTVQLPAGNANATLTYLPRQDNFRAQLRAVGIQLQQLQTVKERNLELKGVMNLTASARGPLSNPTAQASLQVPTLSIHGQQIKSLSLQAQVANHLANFALDTRAIGTSARARGTVQLTGNYLADATLDTQSIPLGPLLATYMPLAEGNVSGETELHASLRGPLKTPAAIEAHVKIPTLRMNYKNLVQLAAAAPINADYTNGVLQVQRTAIRGTDTNLQLQGSIPIANQSQPMALLVLGTVDLRIAQLFQPSLTTSGQLVFDINSYGQRNNPDVQGQVRIVNANFATGSLPIGLENGNGVLTLTKDRLNITQFHGMVGGGEVSASGGIVYRPALRYDLALTGNAIRVLYQNSVRAAFDTDLAFTGSTAGALLQGSVNVDQLGFTPSFDLMNFMGNFSGSPAIPAPSQSFTDNVRLDVGVTSGGGVELVSKTLSLNAAANLRVNGTAAAPVILGRVNFNGGDLIFLGNRYIIQGGTVDFVNASQTQPVVNLSVNTTIDQYNIVMRFWGPVDHLHTNYSSDPALPPSDIINLVALGKTTEASAANPTPMGPLAAESLVASQVSSQITSRVEKIAGISQLSVDPVLSSAGQQTPGARVTIRQRVTSKIFVTFATDVTSTQRNVMKFEYDITPRKSIDVARDQNGGFSVDTRFRKSW